MEMANLESLKSVVIAAFLGMMCFLIAKRLDSWVSSNTVASRTDQVENWPIPVTQICFLTDFVYELIQI